MLISIFVLAVGLLGVAALIPAGHHEIAQASRLEYASMVGRAAFRDLQVRGYLTPGNTSGTVGWPIWSPTTAPGSPTAPFVVNGVASAQVAVAIDPLALAAGYSTTFNTYAFAGNQQLTRVLPPVGGAPTAAYWDSIFRSSVDLLTVENTTNSDLPPLQSWFVDTSSNRLRRASEGNYSWLATVVSEPTRSALANKVTVSVAVFYKRDLSQPGAGEYIAVVQPSGTGAGHGLGGGDVRLVATGGGPFKAVRPGQWIMLAGRLIKMGTNYDYYRWYRVVAAQNQTTTTQNVTLSGTDWDPELFDNVATRRTYAFIFDNIIAVYEKNLSLEVAN